MERKKKAIALLGTAGLLGVLLVSLIGLGSLPIVLAQRLPESLQSSESGALGPPTAIPGVTYTGSYIQIGLNNGGTFGWGPLGASPGTGFQFPIGSQYESLATGWWGEGYVIAYKIMGRRVWEDRVAYWWPELGWPPPAASRIVPIYAKQLRDDTNRAIYEVKVQTVDKVLNMTFKFSFPKPQKYVLLQTTITNTGAMGQARDVLYKRIVDWDIHNWLDNRWTNDAHAAYASYFTKTLNKWIDMSVAGYTPTALENQVAYVDLSAWDDYTSRGPGSMDIQSHDQPLSGDGNAAVYYDLGNMASGTTKKVMTVYQAGWHYDNGISFALYTLKIKVYSEGTTSPSAGTYTYSAGTAVSVTAYPPSGGGFSYWTLDGVYAGTANPISITMNQDHELIAYMWVLN